MHPLAKFIAFRALALTAFWSPVHAAYQKAPEDRTMNVALYLVAINTADSKGIRIEVAASPITLTPDLVFTLPHHVQRRKEGEGYVGGGPAPYSFTGTVEAASPEGAASLNSLFSHKYGHGGMIDFLGNPNLHILTVVSPKEYAHKGGQLFIESAYEIKDGTAKQVIIQMNLILSIEHRMLILTTGLLDVKREPIQKAR